MHRIALPVQLVVGLALGTIGCGGKAEPHANPDTTAGAGRTPAVTAAKEAPGAEAYAVCAACHQANGEGIPNAFPPLAGSDYVNGHPEAHIAIVLKGLAGPVVVKGQTFNSQMAAWETLSDGQIADAINYERASWGNSGKAVTTDDVAAVRAAVGSRTTPWTAEELKVARLR